MPKHITKEQVIDRFETLNPTLHIVSDVGNKSNDIVNIFCDDCKGIFPRIRRDVLKPCSNGCSICRGLYVCKGINDIATTHPHLVKYFANIDDAYKNSKGSHNEIKVRCPYCKNERDMQVKNLVNQGFRCNICDSGISFPNRFAREFLKQLPIQNWICEYSPEWIGRKFYDNYFEYQGKKYILEMDGELGHIKTFKHYVSLDGVINDNYKDNKAKEHGIHVIRIDCKNSDIKEMIKNIYRSDLSKIFDLSIIDWDKCSLDAIDNLYVKICEFYKDGQKPNKEIMNHFKVGISTVSKALRIGGEIGIIDYSYEIAKKRAAKNGICQKQNRIEIVVDLYKGTHYIGRFNNVMSAVRVIAETYPDVNKKSIASIVYKGGNTYKEFKFIRSNKNEYKVC